MKLTERQQMAVKRVKDRLVAGLDRIEEVPCVCGQDNLSLVADYDRHGIPSRTVICRRCGLIFVTPRPDEKALRRFYNEDYFDLYASKSAVDEAALYSIQKKQGEAVISFLATAGVDANWDTVFDIGCGTGGMLSVFADAGAKIAGVDYAENLIAYGNSRLGDGYLAVGGGERLRAKGVADLIIASHIIEHVSDPVGWAITLRDLVKPGGYIYILTPGLRVGALYMDGIGSFLLNMHLYYFTLGTLTMVMRRAGFSLVRGSELIEALFQREVAISPIDEDEPEGDPDFLRILRKTAYIRPFVAWIRPVWKLRNAVNRWMNH